MSTNRKVSTPAGGWTWSSSRRTTKEHTHTTTASATRSRLKEDLRGDSNNNKAWRSGTTIMPPFLGTTRSMFDRNGGLHTEPLTVGLRFLDITPSFHTGLHTEGDLHCEDCEVLPRGVGLLLSAFFGSAFFIVYLFIVSVIWQRCPQLSKPPDARLKALEDARRPSISSRLLIMAQQAAGGVGVPLKPPLTKVTATTSHHIKRPTSTSSSGTGKASEIVDFWTRISGRPPHENLKVVSSNEEAIAEKYELPPLLNDSGQQHPHHQYHQPHPHPHHHDQQMPVRCEAVVDVIREREPEFSLRRSFSASSSPFAHLDVPPVEVVVASPSAPEIRPKPPPPKSSPIGPTSESSPKIVRIGGEASFDSDNNFSSRPKRLLCSPLLSGSKLFTKRRKARLVRQRSLSGYNSQKWWKEGSNDLESPIFSCTPQFASPSTTCLTKQTDSVASQVTTIPNRDVVTMIGGGGTTTMSDNPSSALGSSFVSSSVSTGGRQNEFGDFIILLPMPRSVTVPRVNSRLMHPDGSVSPMQRAPLPMKPYETSFSSIGEGTTAESGVFVDDRRDTEIWVSKFKLSSCARDSSSLALKGSSRKTITSSRADFYSNSKFLFMNE